MRVMSLPLRTELTLLLALALFLSSVPLSYGAPAAAAPAPNGCVEVPAQSLASQPSPRGIPNFGQVTPLLFRGGQPTTDGYRELKQMGVEVVVSFRHETGENTLERRAVEALGMRFVNMPWHAWDTPTDDQVGRFFMLLAANRQTKIFIHCQQGRDRTGVMMALYRIAVDHWCADSAVAEMNAYHYHHFFFPKLEVYVENFSQRLAADPGLAAAVALLPPTLP
jgi:tyrosine-protein phosphatase SIW14